MADERATRSDVLARRTKAFALRAIKLFGALAKGDVVAQVLGKQVLRSATSVGAQYREACRARSRAEFVSKVESALQELEESRYWFELLVEAEVVPERRMQGLMDEARELIAILTASAKTAKRGVPRRSAGE
jgi:four helix bundle protein